MPIQYVQVNGQGLDHEHQVNPNGHRVNFDRYPCVAQNCWAEFQAVETAPPGAHRRARAEATVRRIEAEQAARAAAVRKAQRRRRWRGRFIDLTVAVVCLIVLWVYAKHGAI